MSGRKKGFTQKFYCFNLMGMEKVKPEWDWYVSLIIRENWQCYGCQLFVISQNGTMRLILRLSRLSF